MFSKIPTKKYTESCSDRVKRLRTVLNEAKAVVIGAGSGLSASAGLTYSGDRFEKYFSDFIEKYHIPDMYAGGFYPYSSLEEYWAWWSRHIFYNRYVDAPKPVYQQLLKVVKDKDYFVLTTNVDHQFQRAGFDKGRLFYTQGDYGLWQCAVPCHLETYDNEYRVRQMIKMQSNRKIPKDLIPVCPVCGGPMTMNLRIDDRFVENEGWHRAQKNYQDFLRCHTQLSVLFLEMGTGYNTPEEMEEKSICINDDIGGVIQELL